MVASALVTRPTRVFARITFTGEDKNLPPVCCDLSRVAAISAANPLPNTLGNAVIQKSSSKLNDKSFNQSTSLLNFSLNRERDVTPQRDEISVQASVLNDSRKRPNSPPEVASDSSNSAKRQKVRPSNRTPFLNQLELTMSVA